MSADTKFVYTADWEMVSALIKLFLDQGENKENLLLLIAMDKGNAVHSVVGIVEKTTGLHAIVGLTCRCGCKENAVLKGGPGTGRENYCECQQCGSFLFDLVPQSIPWRAVSDAVNFNKISLRPDELSDFQENPVCDRDKARGWLSRLLRG